MRVTYDTSSWDLRLLAWVQPSPIAAWTSVGGGCGRSLRCDRAGERARAQRHRGARNYIGGATTRPAPTSTFVIRSRDSEIPLTVNPPPPGKGVEWCPPNDWTTDARFAAGPAAVQNATAFGMVPYAEGSRPGRGSAPGAAVSAT